GAAVGMLAATISQVAFALVYGSSARHGVTVALLGGCAAFAAATLLLSFLHWPVLQTFALVLVAVVCGYAVSRRRAPAPPSEPVRLPRWDIPVRMVAATTVPLLITSLSPLTRSHLSRLLSPL